MKNLLFSFFLIYFCTFWVQAQPQITWGEPYKQGAFSYLKKIVGYDENGFYAVEDKGVFSSKMILMKFDKNMNQVQDVDINHRQKIYRVYNDILAFPKQMYVLYNNNNVYKEESFELYANALDTKGLTVSNKEVKLYSMDIIKGSNYGYGSYSKLLSRDSSKLALVVDMPSKNKKEPNKYAFKVFSDDLTELWTQTHTFPYQDRFFYFEDAKVSNDGNIYCVGRVDTDIWTDKRQGKPTYSYYVYYLSPNEEKPIEIPLKVDNQFITDLKIGIAPNGDILCAGFYSQKNSFNVEGVFSLTIDGATHKVKQQAMKAIPISTVVENYSEAKQERLEKKEAKGKNQELYGYDLDELILKKEGGFVLIGEQFYVTTYQDYNTNSRSYTTHYRYHFNDIIAVNVDEKGNIIWGEKIGKTQTSTDDYGHLLSYGLMVDNDKLHFIFNDNKKNVDYDGNGRPIPMTNMNRSTLLVSLDKKGKESRQLLFTRDESESYAIPKVSRQISNDALIMYFQRGGKRRFAKIVF